MHQGICRYTGQAQPTWLRAVKTVARRRVTKNDQRFVYDGYLQVANYHLSSTNYHLFVWDPTEPVATRPLVWTKNDISSYYAFDGNKNVSEVLAADGSLAAHYEYAPFGALTAQSGVLAATNPFRFSSEYAEDDTATVYYNYRHYEPVMGRWMGRDFMSEYNEVHYKDGLYLAYLNDPINCVDVIGLSPVSYTSGVWKEEEYTTKHGKHKTKWVKACTLKVTLKMNLKFNNDQRSGVLWTEGKTGTKQKWMDDAKSATENYFNNLSFRCYSGGTCCKLCPNGVNIQFEIIFGKGGAAVTVSNDPSHQSSVRCAIGMLVVLTLEMLTLKRNVLELVKFL